MGTPKAGNQERKQLEELLELGQHHLSYGLIHPAEEGRGSKEASPRVLDIESHVEGEVWFLLEIAGQGVVQTEKYVAIISGARLDLDDIGISLRKLAKALKVKVAELLE
jgi:hypothetical protein